MCESFANCVHGPLKKTPPGVGPDPTPYASGIKLLTPLGPSVLEGSVRMGQSSAQL